jgi:hypothetical protein
MKNIITGTLEIDGPGEVFLFLSEVLESIPKFVNSLTGRCFYCGQRVYDMMLSCFLWPMQPPYILKAGKSIKLFYTKFVHVTSLAHTLHRETVEVRSKLPQVIAVVLKTKIFFKVPVRKMLFKSMGTWCYTAPGAHHHKVGKVD